MCEKEKHRETRTTLQSSGWRRKDEGAPPSVSIYASFKNLSTWYARQSVSVCPACKVECPVKQSARCREMSRQREVVCNVVCLACTAVRELVKSNRISMHASFKTFRTWSTSALSHQVLSL